MPKLLTALPLGQLVRRGGLGLGLVWALGAWCAGGAFTSAFAQAGPAGGRGFRIEPTFDTSVTYSDLQRPAGTDATDTIVQVRPGLRMSGRSGRVSGALSYGADFVHHSLASATSGLQNSLNANLSAEPIENWLFVDASATVAQRSLSAFGQQTVAGSVQENSNRTEVATVSVSPSVRGAVGSLARYELRLTAAATNARKSISGDSSTTGASFNLNSSSGGAIIGWGLQATHQRADFRAGRATTNDRAFATLTARPDPELLLSLRGGEEATDATTGERVKTGNWGLGARWTPNERTLVDVQTDERYFGKSRKISVEHRLPLSSFRFSSTNDVSTSSNPNGVGAPVTLYQLYDALLLSRFPDPIERDTAVRDLLRSQGLDGNTTVSGGFVSNAITLQRRDDLGWTYNGRRTTFSLQAFRSHTSSLDSTAQQAGGGGVRQQGYTASASYRLTPTASTSLTGSRLTTPGTSVNAGTDLKSLSLSWTDQLGRHVSTSLAARYSVFNSLTDPYRDTSVTASLALRF